MTTGVAIYPLHHVKRTQTILQSQRKEPLRKQNKRVYLSVSRYRPVRSTATQFLGLGVSVADILYDFLDEWSGVALQGLYLHGHCKDAEISP